MIKVLDLEFLGSTNTIGSFLIASSAGPILVETGPHSTYKTLERKLAAVGYTTQDIKHVFITHIHLDHAGAAWAFAEQGATIYLHPFGARHFVDTTKLAASAKRIYKDKMDFLWGQLRNTPEEQMYLAAHGEVIEIGDTKITAWHTPGHAVHHIAWQIGKSLIAGDVAGVKINDGIVVPPCPPPDINVEDWQNSIALIRQLDLEELYLAHYGKVTDIDAHLTALETILLDWAAWMKPHWEAGTAHAEIVPLFQAYTQGQLEAKGIKGEDLMRYEKANPSWMSVAGLMRYWKKKASGSSKE